MIENKYVILYQRGFFKFNMISIVIPILNGENQIELLYERLMSELLHKIEFEILFIDDGSSDKTFELLKNFYDKSSTIKIIKFKKNNGQHIALLAGFLMAKGDIIISMDADLRNNPGDIIRLADKINEGFDVVKGNRVKRDATLLRKTTSFLANNAFRLLLNPKNHIHDYGCGLGAFRENLLQSIGQRNTELIKYIHFYCIKKAKTVGEIAVQDTFIDDPSFPQSTYNLRKLLKLFCRIVKALLIPKKNIRPSDLYKIDQILTR